MLLPILHTVFIIHDISGKNKVFYYKNLTFKKFVELYERRAVQGSVQPNNAYPFFLSDSVLLKHSHYVCRCCLCFLSENSIKQKALPARESRNEWMVTCTQWRNRMIHFFAAKTLLYAAKRQPAQSISRCCDGRWEPTRRAAQPCAHFGYAPRSRAARQAFETAFFHLYQFDCR